MSKPNGFTLPGGGLKCGNCGELLPRVYRTTTTPGFVTRERKCECCGDINVTQERIIGTHTPRRTFNQRGD